MTIESTTKRKLYILILPWISWFLSALFFTHQYFLQVSVASLEPSLVKNFHFTPNDIGTIAASFYISYIVFKFVAGVLIDTYGARLMLTLSTLLCAIATFLFAQFDTLVAMTLSRILMGIGASFAYLGTMKLITAWFDNKRVVMLNAVTLALGALGAIIGEGPIAALLKITTRNEIIDIAGWISLALSVVIFIFIRNKSTEKQTGEKPAALTQFKACIHSLKNMTTHRTLWIIGILSGLITTPMIAFYSLWGPIFITHIYHVSNSEANFVISLAFIGAIFGLPFHGFVANKIESYIKPIRWFALLAAITLTTIIIFKPPISIISILIFITGFSTAVGSLVFPLTGEIVGAKTVAIGIAFVSSLYIAGGTIISKVIGLLLSLHWGHGTHNELLILNPVGFRLTLLAIPLVVLAGVFLSRYAQDKRP